MSHSFLNFLSGIFANQEEMSPHHSLLQQIQDQIPGRNEDEALLIYSIAGLLSRIAYNDLDITAEEKNEMQKALMDWGHITQEQAETIGDLANTQMKLFAGIDNHKYCSPLIDLLEENQRYELLETLFKIAQSDGKISASEDLEIRGIATALGLPHRFFTAARAKIMNS